MGLVLAEAIAAAAQTRRQQVVALALAARLELRGAQLDAQLDAREIVALAQTALLAVDEDINRVEIEEGHVLEAAAGATLSIDQQIRATAVSLSAVAAIADPHDNTLSELVDATLHYADQIAAYIRDGKVAD